MKIFGRQFHDKTNHVQLFSYCNHYYIFYECINLHKDNYTGKIKVRYNGKLFEKYLKNLITKITLF